MLFFGLPRSKVLRMQVFAHVGNILIENRLFTLHAAKPGLALRRRRAASFKRAPGHGYETQEWMSSDTQTSAPSNANAR